jgi:uracil phosphoribosyltransferase
MLTVINEKASALDRYLMEIRDIELQRYRLLFNENLECLAMFLGYEISKRLNYQKHNITTPLGTIDIPLIEDHLVIATILRAGLPIQSGLQKIFKKADLAFVAAERREKMGEEVSVDLFYRASSSLKDSVLIIGDTMLASGHSIVDSYNELVENYGQPNKVFLACVIASLPGVAYAEKHIKNVEIVTCALDEKLDENFYIVPGLGDAGDLLYGEKA